MPDVQLEIGLGMEDEDPFASIGKPFEVSNKKALEPTIVKSEELLDCYLTEPKQKVKMVKDSNQFKRSMKDINLIFPGWYWKTEHYTTLHGGMQIKRDYGGFADIVGVSSGKHIAVQITTLDQVGPHIRKYVSDAKSGGFGDTTIEVNLRSYLQNGGTFVILGYYKEGARWAHKVTYVTEETLDAAVSRKRRK